MASARRKTTIELADSSFERVAARELSRLLAVLPPWVGWIVTLVLGITIHALWSNWAATISLCLVGVCLAALSVHLTRERKGFLGRFLGALSDLAVFGWLAAIDIAGPSSSVLGVWFIGGIGAGMAWSHWLHIRGQGDQLGLGALFDRAAEPTQVRGMKLLRVKMSERRAETVHQLKPGDTASDVIKSVAQLESAAKLPPGSLSATVHEDRADWVSITASDPRVLRKPQPWPGPSAPGKSINEPLRIGMRQDGEPVQYTVTNHHLLMMGATGAGKTEGGAWNELAETITRADAAVMAIDVTKGDQFLGPLRVALHSLDTGKPEAKERLRKLHQSVRARTDYLATRKLGRWVEGCGLTHLTFWIEEAPDVINLLSDAELEDFISDMRSARSAGIRIVLSLQRSDWTQLPTIVRAQMAKMCFGVLDDQDAAFGLSPYQKEHGCSPELWGDSYPGMFYLDAACIAKPAKSMENRGWYWGKDTTKIEAHAAAYPASARPLDDVTAAVFGMTPAAAPPHRPLADYVGAVADGTIGASAAEQAEAARIMAANRPHAVPDPEDTMDTDDDVITAAELAAVADAVTTDGPLPEADTSDLPEPSPELAGWEFGGDQVPAVKLDTDAAKARFEQQIADWQRDGTRQFGVEELSDLRTAVGRSRPWLYEQLEEAERAGTVRKIGRAQWEVLAA